MSGVRHEDVPGVPTQVLVGLLTLMRENASPDWTFSLEVQSNGQTLTMRDPQEAVEFLTALRTTDHVVMSINCTRNSPAGCRHQS